jgi:hypothetical protein
MRQGMLCASEGDRNQRGKPSNYKKQIPKKLGAKAENFEGPMVLYSFGLGASLLFAICVL